MQKIASSHPSPDQLIAFGVGQLSGAERTRVENHVATCVACCELLQKSPPDALVALVQRAHQPGAASGSADTGVPSDSLIDSKAASKSVASGSNRELDVLFPVSGRKPGLLGQLVLCQMSDDG